MCPPFRSVPAAALDFFNFMHYVFHMTMEQTIKVPANRRITFEVPSQVPVGTIARLELVWPHPAKTEDSPAQSHSRAPISRYFGILSRDTYGDGVAYQGKLRDEWDD